MRRPSRARKYTVPRSVPTTTPPLHAAAHVACEDIGRAATVGQMEAACSSAGRWRKLGSENSRNVRVTHRHALRKLQRNALHGEPWAPKRRHQRARPGPVWQGRRSRGPVRWGAPLQHAATTRERSRAAAVVSRVAAPTHDCNGAHSAWWFDHYGAAAGAVAGFALENRCVARATRLALAGEIERLLVARSAVVGFHANTRRPADQSPGAAKHREPVTSLPRGTSRKGCRGWSRP